jgi:ectoine hydroxylase-related dioxygenase (phytanoyl-CoA dioxygenase family)
MTQGPEATQIPMTLKGVPVPPGSVSTMAAADIEADLARQLDRDGYLLLRGVHDPDAVEAARLEILHRLAEVGEVKEPVEKGLASGTSSRREKYPTTQDLGSFWRSVSEGEALRAVINGARITNIMSQLFQEPADHFTFAWLRAMAAGRASPLHIDHPYMNRGSQRLLTCWSPLCPISLYEGPLYILEGSHSWTDIRGQFEGLDVDRDPSRPGHIEEIPISLVERKKSKFLTSEFELGDCLVFGMFTVHGSFDNNSKADRIRLSCDTRFQPAADPMDCRFSGPNPPAHGGLGYGCLSAALPMTETSALR